MKKLLTILLAVVMLIGAMSLTASAAMPSTYYAPYGSVTVDGVVSDGEWDAASYVELANVITEMPMLADPIMKIMHDGTYMYVLVEVMTPDVTNDNIFVCVHMPHDGCSLDGCKSYLKFVIGGKALVTNGDDYLAWGYWADINYDGVNDFTNTDNGSQTDIVKAVYGYADDTLYAELKVAAAYGEAITLGEAAYIDVRVEDNNFPPLSSHTWADQALTWDAQYNPATDGGEVIFLAQGEEAPVVTEPVETEPVETEPVTTEEVTTEEITTEPEETEEETTAEQTEEETEPTTDADETPEEESAFPVVPVVIAVVVVLAVIVGIIIAKKKKD